MNSTPPTALALLALLALAPSAPATAQEAAPTQDTGREAREIDRLLTLLDGRVIRARSRWNGEAWEVRTAGGWKALPPGAVDRVRTERDLLSEAKRLAREVPRDDLDRRVALADWMLRQGLAEEGLEQLDRVLRAEADHELALALLADPPQPLRLAALSVEDPQELLRAAAGAPPSVRELAIQRLAQVAGDDARELLQQALESHSVRLRTFAAVALRRLYPGQEVRPLAVRSILDGSEAVRREASLSLRAVGQPAVILPAVRALESSHEGVRENAIESLGWMGYPAAVPPLIARLSAVQGAAMGQAAPRANIFVGRQLAYIQDFDVEVAQGAAIADPVVNTLTEGSVLDVRVVGVHIFTTAVETRRIRRSLAQLVGEERSARGWLEWWETHQDEYAAPATAADGGRPVTGG
jgi:hypothetical protein